MTKLSILLIGFVFLTGCAAMMPDVAQIIHDVEDTAIVIEINRDAIKTDTDIHVIVDVLNKDIPKPK